MWRDNVPLTSDMEHEQDGHNAEPGERLDKLGPRRRETQRTSFLLKAIVATLLILNVLTLVSAALKLKSIYSSITLALDVVETRSLPVMDSGNGLESLR